MATKIFNEPVPGVLVDTEMGDVIYILDRVTGTMGIHAPDDMQVSTVFDLVEEVYTHFIDKEIDPFSPDDDLPMVVEESFIFSQLGA